MTHDGLTRFRETEYNQRTEVVPTPVSMFPALAPLFLPDDQQEIEVKALEGEEIYRADVRVEQNRDFAEQLEKAFSKSAKDRIGAAMSILGLDSEEVPGQMVYEIAAVEFGVIKIGGKDAKLEQEDVVKLFKNCLPAARMLGKKILKLSGMGNVPLGEFTASGTTPE